MGHRFLTTGGRMGTGLRILTRAPRIKKCRSMPAERSGDSTLHCNRSTPVGAVVARRFARKQHISSREPSPAGSLSRSIRFNRAEISAAQRFMRSDGVASACDVPCTIASYWMSFRSTASPRSIVASLAAYDMRKWVSRWLKTLPGMMSSSLSSARETNPSPVPPPGTSGNT